MAQTSTETTNSGVMVMAAATVAKPKMAEKIGFLCASSVGFRTVTGNIRSPDVLLVLRRRLPEGQLPEGFMEGAPDLVIEVTSPNEDWSELVRKTGEYFMSGAKQVWLIDPQTQTLTIYKSLTDVHVFHADHEVSGGDLLPDLHCKVTDLISVP